MILVTSQPSASLRAEAAAVGVDYSPGQADPPAHADRAHPANLVRPEARGTRRVVAVLPASTSRTDMIRFVCSSSTTCAVNRQVAAAMLTKAGSRGRR